MAVVVKSRIGKTRLREAGREKADRAVKFISQLKHSTGEWAGKPFTLMPWQENEIIRPFYGTLNPDGTRQYRTIWIEIPKKNGKTELGAGGIALPLLYIDGEMGAQIYSAANDKKQAGLVFDAAAPMVEQNPRLNQLSRIYPPQKRIVYYRNRSFYTAVSSEAYTKDGINAHGIIYDELHAAPDRELWDVLTTSQGARRQPVTAVTTTAGFDRNSICWELHDYACKVRDGIINDPTWLVIIYAAPEEADWTDEDVWRACNPALGTFRSLSEMRNLCKRAQETPALEMTYRRLYLNQWTSSVKRWMPMKQWDACAGEINISKRQGERCYGGLDLASSVDLTALSLVFPREGGYDVLMHFWIPEATAAENQKRDRVPYLEWARQGLVHLTPGNVIDYGFIRQTIKDVRGQYNLRELAYDRYGARQLIENLEEDGFLVEPEEIQKNKNSTAPVIVPFGQGFLSMSPTTKELMTLVLQKKIRHGGHSVLRWNADNMVVQQDAAGNLKPDKAKATQKIDGMVALIMALDRAIRHGDEGGSVYDKRGIVSL